MHQTQEILLRMEQPLPFHTQNHITTADTTKTVWLFPNWNGLVHSMERTFQELVLMLELSNIALTSMREWLSPMVRPELSHTHNHITIATQITQLHNKNKHGLRDLMVKTWKWLELILEHMLWSTAQTSMRDILSLMDILEPSPIHNQDTTATPITPFINSIVMIWELLLLMLPALRDALMN